MLDEEEKDLAGIHSSTTRCSGCIGKTRVDVDFLPLSTLASNIEVVAQDMVNHFKEPEILITSLGSLLTNDAVRLGDLIISKRDIRPLQANPLNRAANMLQREVELDGRWLCCNSSAIFTSKNKGNATKEHSIDDYISLHYHDLRTDIQSGQDVKLGGSILTDIGRGVEMRPCPLGMTEQPRLIFLKLYIHCEQPRWL